MLRTHDDGQRPTGPHADGGDYPFVAPSDDIRGLFDSVWLSLLDRPARPLRVSEVSGFASFFDDEFNLEEAESDSGSSSSSSGSGSSEDPAYVRIVIVDADDAVVFDSDTAAYYSQRQFGPRLWFHEWIGDDVYCRVVQHAACPPDVAVVPYELTFEPEDAVLDVRTWETAPGRLNQLVVSGVDYVSYSNDIVFTNGFNTEWTFGSGRLGDRLTLTVEPGSGEGRFPCATTMEGSGATIITSVNGVKPDKYGNVNIRGAECVFARPASDIDFWYGADEPPAEFHDVRGDYLEDMLASVESMAATHTELESYSYAIYLPLKLWVGDDCKRPCKPKHFTNTYKALQNENDVYRQLGLRAEAIRVRLAALAVKCQEIAACKKDDVVRVNAIAIDHSTVAIAASICNAQSVCVRDVELEVTVDVGGMEESDVGAPCEQSLVDRTCIVQQSRVRHGRPSVYEPDIEVVSSTRTVYRFNAAMLLRSECLGVRFIVRLPCQEDPDTSSTVFVDVSAVAYGNAEPIVNSANEPASDTITCSLPAPP